VESRGCNFYFKNILKYKKINTIDIVFTENISTIWIKIHKQNFLKNIDIKTNNINILNMIHHRN